MSIYSGIISVTRLPEKAKKHERNETARDITSCSRAGPFSESPSLPRLVGRRAGRKYWRALCPLGSLNRRDANHPNKS